jgi:site-specific DNA-methyltransferase (adenine-specific)
MNLTINGNRYFNIDCISGCQKHIADNTVDLIITDPPYGINGDRMHKHYNRKEDYVTDGYIEIPREAYHAFSHAWIREAERILKPNGQIYLFSGYTNLYHILDALQKTRLQQINHLIWKYNFGVFTKKKYISSHYHILYYEKPGTYNRTFNTECRFGLQEKDDNNGSLNYQDREDVWRINREYKPGKSKNKNELPTILLIKLMQYSSNEGDLVCDLFMGGFSTAKVAIGLNRRFVGFELSPTVFEQNVKDIKRIKRGYLLPALRKPEIKKLKNQMKPWTETEKNHFFQRYASLRKDQKTQKESLAILSEEFGRGYWALMKLLSKS